MLMMDLIEDPIVSSTTGFEPVMQHAAALFHLLVNKHKTVG
jgi:hypothetical protein